MKILPTKYVDENEKCYYWLRNVDEMKILPTK